MKAIRNMTVYSETGIIKDGYVLIDDGKISGFGEMSDFPAIEAEIIEASGSYLIPGMIDIHIHGSNGADAMDATKETLQTMAASLVREGTTSFLATTMTQSDEAIIDALKNVANYIDGQQTNEAQILGVHLEGPFVNKVRAGAQPLEYIIDPNIEKFSQFQAAANGLIKLITMAPERPNGIEFVEYLRNNDVVVSMGHTDATYDEVMKAIEAGARHFTHTFNQLRPLHHREPGAVGAALLAREAFTELIVDGKHVNQHIVDLTYRIKGADRILLITDSMRAKYLPDGEYELGGQPVIVQNNEAKLADGKDTLAGSIVKMCDAAKNMMEFTGCSLEEIVKMTSTNQAKCLGVFDKKGSISVGKDADMVILDENYEVITTICCGHIAYERGTNE